MIDIIISFETAKLAKEKGFNIITLQMYGNQNIPQLEEYNKTKYNIYKDYLFAPTQSILSKWLREKHKIDIIPYPIVMIRGEREIEQESPEYTFYLYIKGIQQFVHGENFLTFEIAFENGLVEGLNKLNTIND